jgi:hypothetical protein
MGKNIIVSEETVRDLLEAHASLSAWYYELWAALRSGNPSPRTPDDAARAAFVEPLAANFPELASVARSIKVPRMFVPSPPRYAVSAESPEAPAGHAPPAAETPSPSATEPGPPVSVKPGGAPPAFVVPSKVKYEP